jgi:hypothetical protein
MAESNFTEVSLLLHCNSAVNTVTFKDHSSKPKVITTVGNTYTSATQSKFGETSAYFDGAGDYLTVPTGLILGTNNFTFEGWIRIASNPTINVYNIATYSASTTGFNLEIDLNGKLGFYTYAATTTYNTSSASVTLNAWNHFAIVRKDNIFYGFLNGILEFTVTKTESYATSVLTIGRCPAVIARDFLGYMDEIRLSNIARYTSTFTPNNIPFLNDNTPSLDSYYNVSLLVKGEGLDNGVLFNDNSNTPKTFTKTGAVITSTAQSRFGTSSLYYDGTGGYLTTSSNSNLAFGTGDFTVECFVNITVAKVYPVIYMTTDTPYFMLSLGSTGRTLRAFVTGSVIDLNGATILELNTWYHIAVTRYGTTVSIYLNGVLQATGTCATDFTSTTALIGENLNPFQGYVDELRVTKGLARYTAAFTPPTATFISNYFGIDEQYNNVSLLLHGQGVAGTTNIVDNSPNPKTITVEGNTALLTVYTAKSGNSAIKFDGTGDRLVIPASNDFAFGNGDYTVECYVYFNTITQKYFLSSEYIVSAFFYIGYNGNLAVVNAGTSTITVTGVPVTTWHHIALVKQNNVVTLYLNGVNVGSTPSPAIPSYSYAANPFYIGGIHASIAGSGNWGDCSLYEVRITKGLAQYTSNFIPSPILFLNTPYVANSNVNLLTGYVTYNTNILATVTPSSTDAIITSGSITYKGSLLHIVAQTLRGGLTHANAIENASSPYLSHDLSEHAVDYWFPHANDTTVQKTNTVLTDNLPISMNTNTIFGDKIAHSYLHDFYYRVHSTITGLVLGNVLSEQVFQLQIWNSWLSDYSLTSINKLNLPDVNLALPVTTPYTFTPLKFIDGTVTVAATGQAAIEGTYTLVFQGQELVIDVSGQRVILWPFIPKTNFNETKQWSTDIIASRHGEQRLSNREIPRRALQFNYTFKESSEYVLAKQLANTMCHLAAATPLWSDVTYLTNLVIGQTVIYLDTTKLEYYVNGLVVFWKSYLSYDIAEISAVYSDRIILKLGLKHNYSSCWAAPTLIGYLPNGITLSRGENQEKSCSIAYNIVDSFNSGVWSVTDTFLTLPVLTASSVVTGGLDEKFSRNVEVFDSESGNFIPLDVEDYNRHRQSIQIKSRSVTELYNLRRMFDYLQGKYKTFWLPSYNNDYIASTNLSSGATSINVIYSQLGTYPIGYVRITGKTLAGVAISSYFTVSGTTSNTDGTDTIGLSPAVATAIYNISRIDVMKKVRLDTDTIEFTHSNKRITTVKATVVEVL